MGDKTFQTWHTLSHVGCYEVKREGDNCHWKATSDGPSSRRDHWIWFLVNVSFQFLFLPHNFKQVTVSNRGRIWFLVNVSFQFLFLPHDFKQVTVSNRGTTYNRFKNASNNKRANFQNNTRLFWGWNWIRTRLLYTHCSCLTMQTSKT